MKGEKNRDYEGKVKLDKVKELYNLFLKENSLIDDNIDKTLNHWNTYREFRGSENIGFMRFIEKLQKENSLSPSLIKLSRYIRIKLDFKEFQIINYYDDIASIINLNTKKKGILSGGLYNRWLDKIKHQKNNIKIIKDEYHCVRWFGAFNFNKLVGFCSINIDGELAGIGYFFTDPNYLKYSISTFLLINIIKYLYSIKFIKCLNYWMNNCKGQLDMMKWKKRFRFEESCLTINDF